MKIQLTQQIIVSNKSSKFAQLDELCFLSKNLCNADVNGSLNIMRLVLEKQNVKLDVLEEILRPENKRFVLNPSETVLYLKPSQNLHIEI